GSGENGRAQNSQDELELWVVIPHSWMPPHEVADSSQKHTTRT
ncbi:1424_t:CDS:2, partial [Ambispora gerdemannii]